MSSAAPRQLLAVLLVGLLGLLLSGTGTPTASAQEQYEQPAVLVYSRTAGFRHLSIPDGIRAIRELGDAHGFAVEATEDPAVFTDESLSGFDAVVFLNTTGDVVPDDGQAAFERYLRTGGGYVGVHAAADTEYAWGFYEQVLAGAYFLAHPVQQPGVVVTEDAEHASTAHLPGRWTIPLEEFYSFRANPRERAHVLLSIDESTYLQDPNTTHLPNSPTFPEGESGVMGDHPMSWCHEVDEGRAWYTALGHENYLYELPDYRQHLLGGILTAVGTVESDCRPHAAASATDGPSEQPADAGAERLPASSPRPPGADVGVAAASLPATGIASAPSVAGVVLLLAGFVLSRPRRPGRG